MQKLLIAFSTALAMSVAPAFADSLTRQARVDLLSKSVGELIVGDRTICTVGKIAPKRFLTARHCVESLAYNTFTIRYKANSSTFYGENRVVTSIHVGLNVKSDDRKGDWAVVYTETDISDMATLKLSCSGDVKLGQAVAAMGYPWPMGRYYTEGYVNSTAGLQQRGANSDFFLDLRAAPGSSGGPVIDAGTGEVIGVLVEIILPARVGNIATGVQSARVNELCKPYQNTAAASSKAIEPASDLYGSSAYGSH